MIPYCTNHSRVDFTFFPIKIYLDGQNFHVLLMGQQCNRLLNILSYKMATNFLSLFLTNEEVGLIK